MITLSQEICCLDCRHATLYFSPIGEEYDRIICKANGTPNGWSGCSRYTQR